MALVELSWLCSFVVVVVVVGGGRIYWVLWHRFM